MRKISKVSILLISLLLVFSSLTVATIEERVQEDFPESYFEATKTASQLGITEFNQSPILDEKVNKGELPPVAERLPEDPVAFEPIDRIGDYGGTHRVLHTHIRSTGNDAKFLSQVHLFGITPLGKRAYPMLAKDYRMSEDGTEFSLSLREGIKWSDGHPFTAEDIMYWWEAEANNEDLNPIPPSQWKPVGIEKVEKIDDYTVKIHFNKPNPLFIVNPSQQLNQITGFGIPDNDIGTPAHYLKQFHPEYTEDPDQLEKMVEEEGFEQWYQLYSNLKQSGNPDSEAPTLHAYILKEKSSTSLLYERNPYFPFVDSEGNQLPYVDELRQAQIQDWSMYNAQASTGGVTFGLGRATLSNMRLFKRNENKENYTVVMGEKAHSAQARFMPNMNHEDPQIRDLMQKDEFRQALSLAINREEINKTFFYGLAKPSEMSVHPSHPYYEDSYSKYIEFDTEKAAKLLDEIDIVDTNNDGWRELPNGEKLNLTVEYFEYGGEIPKLVEMVVSHWQDVGINIQQKQQNPDLLFERINASKQDMTVYAYWFVLKPSFPAFNIASGAFVPTTNASIHTAQWNEWARWNATDGENGIEPPAEVKQLIKWYDTAISTTDESEREALCKKILEVNAEKVWNIGTVGRWEKPLIVNDNLKNVPDSFLQAGSLRPFPANFFMTFFEDGQAAE